jgi:hypothetical protein
MLEKLPIVVFGPVAALIVGGIIASPIVHYSTMETVEAVKVTEKERVTQNSGETMTSKYLIFTDRETFENSDSLFGWKFNSSDMYGKIQRNQVCTFTVTGFRVPFLSMYRNILEASCK